MTDRTELDLDAIEARANTVAKLLSVGSLPGGSGLRLADEDIPALIARVRELEGER